ncbi:hypothetical protein ACGFI9_09815 [Micromonospora sp. NPDC048930]|uniref:hypothetical protein n=1 Tax=Micromonospora sp. NPDC048930 TaxID=3364261 RepID=UPI003720B5D0
MKYLLAVGLVIGLVAAPTAPAAAAVPPAKVTSNYETASGNTLARDCGYSVGLTADQALWLFCDTVLLNPAGEAFGFIGGTTAAAGPYTAGAVPDALSELTTPPAPATVPNSDGPHLFLPVPAGLVLPDGTLCGAAGSNSYAASWLSGATRGPARYINGYWGPDLVAMTYTDVCVRGQWDWTVQAWGISFYHPASNTFVAHHRVFATGASADLPWQRQLGSPVFADDGYLYLYASHCDDSAFGACGKGRTVLARTPWRSSTGWSKSGSYRYWSPSGWTSDLNVAPSVMAEARPLYLDVRSYPGIGFAAVEQTTIGGHYRVWRASSPVGPWTAGAEVQVPGCESSTDGWCYAFFGHSELSTADALMLSYYDPDNKHVMVAAVPW